MSKTIDFQILAKVIRDLDRIFDADMEDYPDYRIIRANERAIDRWFEKMGADDQMKRDIYDTHVRFDPTYKAQCDRLRAKGYIIVNNQKKEDQ